MNQPSLHVLPSHPASLKFWLALNQLPRFGLKSLMRLLQTFQHIEEIFEASHKALKALRLKDEIILAIKHPDWCAVDEALRWALREEHHILSFADTRYPQSLKEIAHPPLLLFVQGNALRLSEPQLAIVGSRHPTQLGKDHAYAFARELAHVGLIVTSGLALGIDGAAHRGALSAGSASPGHTIGVAGTGLHHVYPPAHQMLVKEIIEQGGAIVSEFPLALKPAPSHFPQRNRIIAGLSQGVLVVEATLKSGSLITARYAMEEGREVFAIPGLISQPQSKGCHALIRQGAKLVEHISDILEELPGCAHAMVSSSPKSSPPVSASKTKSIPKASTVTRTKSELTFPYQQLLAEIDYEITPMDMIILRTRLTAREVSSMLLELELQELIQSVPGGYIKNLDHQ